MLIRRVELTVLMGALPLGTCLVPLLAQRIAPSSSTPSQVVSALYRAHMATDKGFTEESLRRKRRWLMPKLYGLLLYERRRAVPNGDVPYIDGDPFTDSQDGPDRWGIKSITQKGTVARVDVFFDWLNHGKVTEHRVSHIKLMMHGGQWRIADIQQPDGRSLLAEMRKLKRQDSSAGRKQGKRAAQSSELRATVKSTPR